MTHSFPQRNKGQSSQVWLTKQDFNEPIIHANLMSQHHWFSLFHSTVLRPPRVFEFRQDFLGLPLFGHSQSPPRQGVSKQQISGGDFSESVGITCLGNDSNSLAPSFTKDDAHANLQVFWAVQKSKLYRRTIACP